EEEEEEEEEEIEDAVDTQELQPPGNNGKRDDNNLTSAIDGHDADSSSLSQPVVMPSLMSLEHDLRIPRRRGRVSQSLMAQFVAELGDSSSSSSSSNTGGENSDADHEMDVQADEVLQVKTERKFRMSIDMRLGGSGGGGGVQGRNNGHYVDHQSSAVATKTTKRHHSSMRTKRKAQMA
ncbi:hypothetical protein BGZ65_010012, partial [Modicella reniformis]